MLQGYYIIDAHCHVYPDKIAEKASLSTGRFYEMDIEMCDGKISTLRDIGDRAGVDHYVIQSVATTPKQVASINNFIAETVKGDKDIFTGLGTLHPDSENIEEDIEQIVALGLHGVKLHPDIQRFKVDDPLCDRMYEICGKYSLPMLIHTGDKRFDYSNPDRVLNVLEKYPNLTIIGAHLGGWSVWEEAAEKLKGIPNLYYDCSSTFYWTGYEKAAEYIKILGTDRVLFGTDYPMWRPHSELESFFKMGFSEEDNRKMLSENAKRVYKIVQ